jgi:hypothetical protein
MTEYKQWLESMIDKCFDDEDLQREHWAFCKAYEKFVEEESKLPQQEISDEEILEAAYKYAEVYQCPTDMKMCKHDVISAWNKAIKWYREQLKQLKSNQHENNRVCNNQEQRNRR